MQKKLYDVFAYFVGNKTGGLPCAAVMTCLFYGAISGSAPATAAAVGGMTFPLLVRLGYEKNFVAALIATAGGLGVIIPPSIPFVLYSSSTNVSLGDMFTAGFLPGFLMGFLLMAYCVIYCRKPGRENKEMLSKHYSELHKMGLRKVFLDGIWVTAFSDNCIRWNLCRYLYSDGSSLCVSSILFGSIHFCVQVDPLEGSAPNYGSVN